MIAAVKYKSHKFVIPTFIELAPLRRFTDNGALWREMSFVENIENRFVDKNEIFHQITLHARWKYGINAWLDDSCFCMDPKNSQDSDLEKYRALVHDAWHKFIGSLEVN